VLIVDDQEQLDKIFPIWKNLPLLKYVLVMQKKFSWALSQAPNANYEAEYKGKVLTYSEFVNKVDLSNEKLK
jgi:hypothetical protein